jgi:hypothetical protein
VLLLLPHAILPRRGRAAWWTGAPRPPRSPALSEGERATLIVEGKLDAAARGARVILESWRVTIRHDHTTRVHPGGHARRV